jgi:subtilisin family serine protease
LAGTDFSLEFRPIIDSISEKVFDSPLGVRIDARAAAVDGDWRNELFNGTSAATPYTAGIIALLMQKKPTHSADEFRTLTQQMATHDSVTAATPNPARGYRKLDLTAVEKMIDAVK